MTSHSPASSPELPKLPDLPLAYYAADYIRAYATAHGLACYEAAHASHAAPTVPVDAVVGEPVARLRSEGDGGQVFIDQIYRPLHVGTHEVFAASMASRAQTEWQPISTAPKDGTAIYVVVADALKPEAGVAHWFSDTWRGGQDIDWQGTENPHEHFGVYPSPTHWQPLPTPPATPGETK